MHEIRNDLEMLRARGRPNRDHRSRQGCQGRVQKGWKLGGDQQARAGRAEQGEDVGERAGSRGSPELVSGGSKPACCIIADDQMCELVCLGLVAMPLILPIEQEQCQRSALHVIGFAAGTEDGVDTEQFLHRYAPPTREKVLLAQDAS
jgi:hypothetical protein